jgi:hypothetical protein
MEGGKVGVHEEAMMIGQEEPPISKWVSLTQALSRRGSEQHGRSLTQTWIPQLVTLPGLSVQLTFQVGKLMTGPLWTATYLATPSPPRIGPLSPSSTASSANIP